MEKRFLSVLISYHKITFHSVYPLISEQRYMFINYEN